MTSPVSSKNIRTPAEIAREAFKELAGRQLQPTPANFQACYNEIAGLPNIPDFPDAPLQALAAGLVANNPAQADKLTEFRHAVLHRDWEGVVSTLIAVVDAGGEAVPDIMDFSMDGDEIPAPEAALSLPAGFSHGLAKLIEALIPVLGEDNPRVAANAAEMALMLRQPGLDALSVQQPLEQLAHQVSYAAEEQAEIRVSLLNLVHLIVENIGELAVDDHWLKGQIDGLLASVAPPLTLRHLDEMERRLRDVMEKQGRAKARSVEAQAEIRQMLAEFIANLSVINQSSSAFEQRIEAGAQRIERAASLEELRPLLSEMAAASHAMAVESARSREQLKTLEEHVKTTEAELLQLHQELDNASALARHDPLTDALNRKGLDEALAREIASMRRKESPLSISLLDIDNFKNLNDRLGHDAGDGALIHLANVCRRNMRPSDTLARYGGEEFVVLMPDTALAAGVEAMTRLQRELTKAIYLSGKERVLITFSAGVAQLAGEESGMDAIRRADQAMYLAKRAGKNRVMGA